MTIGEQVFSQALLLAGELSQQETELLRVLCQGAVASLTARLRRGLTPEDCRADFISAACLFALASMSSVDPMTATSQIAIGDVTIRRDQTDAASHCLRSQAELIIAPYLQDRFSFLGV